MAKEIRVDFDRISDPNTITQENKKIFAEHDLRTNVNEAREIIDEPVLKKRIYKVKNTKYFGPWSHRG